jgi:alanine dehydrogenase
VTEARFLSSNELVGLASPEEYVAEIRMAYRQIGEGAPADPRTQQFTEDQSGSMTSYIAILPKTGVMGGYVYSAGFEANDAWFMTPLFDANTGQPLALVDGAYMNPFKTGAVGAVGSDALARADASVLAIIGTGKQARGQLRAHTSIRDFAEIKVYSPTEEHRDEFAAWASTELNRTVSPVHSSAEAVAGADVIVTATTAEDPVFDFDDVSPGSHITAIGQYTPGKRELDEETVRHAKYVPDLRDRAFQDAGSFLHALQSGSISKDHVHAELGDVVAGTAAGRSSDDEITVFDSGGTAIETVAAANLLYRKARKKQKGTMIDFAPASEILP